MQFQHPTTPSSPLFLSGLRLLGATTLAFAMLAPSPRPAHAGDLAAYLERAERMNTANEKVEADVTVRDPSGAVRKLHVAIDPAGDGKLTVEAADTGWKSETPLAWKEGTVVRKTGASPEKIGVDEPLAGTELRGIDFFPFWKTDYSRALTSDENTREHTISLYADKGRPYALYVVTFDKEKMVPRILKYYRDTFSNLVRIRTDKGWVMVGSRPRPGAILIRDFQTNALATYTFSWKLAGSAEAVPAAPEEAQ
jgi:hypothetical protein